MKTDYKILLRQAEGLVENVDNMISNMANLSALIYQELQGINWAGFYIADRENLFLGPFQGKPACTVIMFGKGVCGTAACEDRTVLVPDVHQFPGHIACDAESRSEIVIPVHFDGKVAAVMDIDSPIPERFTGEDRTGLESIVKILEKNIKSYII